MRPCGNKVRNYCLSLFEFRTVYAGAYWRKIYGNICSKGFQEITVTLNKSNQITYMCSLFVFQQRPLLSFTFSDDTSLWIIMSQFAIKQSHHLNYLTYFALAHKLPFCVMICSLFRSHVVCNLLIKFPQFLFSALI